METMKGVVVSVESICWPLVMSLMLNMSPSMTSFLKKLIKYANKNQMSVVVCLISQQVLLLVYRT